MKQLKHGLTFLSCVFVGVLLLTSKPMAAEYFLISEVGSSAEMIGMGNIEGYGSAANSIFDNPAALKRVNRGSVSVFTTTFMNELTYTSIAVATTTPIGKIGFGYMEAAVSNIPFTEISTGNSQFYSNLNFDYKNQITKISYENTIAKNLSVGASLVQYSTSFYTFSGKATNMDLGATYDLNPIELSLFARNIFSGQQIQIDDGVETLPTQVVGGVKYTYNDVAVMGQCSLKQGKNLFAAGVNYTPSFLPYIQLTAGYKQFLALNNIKSNVTLGLGFKLDMLQLNYAYEKSEHLLYDNKNYFSMSLNF
ncbi:MAG: hypothetical protein AB7F28_03335 [Candidatus Margulisiibacteriota bacterium]